MADTVLIEGLVVETVVGVYDWEREVTQNLVIDLARTAIVVIDMQNAYASAGGYLDLAGFDVSGTGPVVAQIARAVTAARSAARGRRISPMWP